MPAQATPPVAGYFAWYDASDAASITSSAGLVSQWNDKSGNARHLTQGTAGDKPTTGTRTINGLNVIDFVSADKLTSANITQAQPLTIFGVARSDVTAFSGAFNNQFLGNMGFTPTLYMNSSNQWGYYCGTEQSSGVAVDLGPHVLSAIFNGASSQLWVDMISRSTGNPGAAGYATLPIQVGTDISGDFWDGVVGEILIYASALSAANRTAVEGYLVSKWITPSAVQVKNLQSIQRASFF